MAQLFRLNEKWPYPLKPSEYVQRQFHVQFQDDPVALACRHITGVSTIVWGNDYPHAEGTFRGSRELIATQFAGVPDDERKAILGGTLGGLLGFEAPVDVGLSVAGAPLRRAGRRRHRRGARHRPRLRAAARVAGRVASWSTTSAARSRARAPTPGRRPRSSPRSRRPAGPPSPTPATCRRAAGAGARRCRRRAVRTHRRRRQQRRDHAVGRLPRRSTPRTSRPTSPCTSAARSSRRGPAWPHFVEQGYGRIVNTTSTGMLGLPGQHRLRHRQGRRGRHGPQRGGGRAEARHQGQLHRPGGLDPDGGRGRPGHAAALVAPMVAYLAHEDCPVTGEIYAAGAGRFQRLFIATTPGWVATASRRSRTSPSTGRRSTTRPATRSPPTSWTGPGPSCPTCSATRSSGYSSSRPGWVSTIQS